MVLFLGMLWKHAHTHENLYVLSNSWKILSYPNNFHSREVVDRISETQLQVGENSDWIIWRLKG